MGTGSKIVKRTAALGALLVAVAGCSYDTDKLSPVECESGIVPVDTDLHLRILNASELSGSDAWVYVVSGETSNLVLRSTARLRGAQEGQEIDLPTREIFIPRALRAGANRVRVFFDVNVPEDADGNAVAPPLGDPEAAKGDEATSWEFIACNDGTATLDLATADSTGKLDDPVMEKFAGSFTATFTDFADSHGGQSFELRLYDVEEDRVVAADYIPASEDGFTVSFAFATDKDHEYRADFIAEKNGDGVFTKAKDHYWSELVTATGQGADINAEFSFRHTGDFAPVFDWEEPLAPS